MLTYICVITLIPALLAADPNLGPYGHPSPDTPNGNNTNNPNGLNNSNDSNKYYKCLAQPDVLDALNTFSGKVNMTINANSSETLNNTLRELVSSTEKIDKVLNETCTKSENDTIINVYQRSLRVLVHVLYFSLKEKKFTEFVKYGGVNCTNAAKKDLLDKWNETLGEIDMTNNFITLKTSENNTTFASPDCGKYTLLSNVTREVLTNHPQNCTAKNVEYLTSIFDFAYQKCNETFEIAAAPQVSSGIRLMEEINFKLILLISIIGMYLLSH